jgi:hypothetical protein
MNGHAEVRNVGKERMAKVWLCCAKCRVIDGKSVWTQSTYGSIQQIDILCCPIKPRVDDGYSAAKGQDFEDIVTVQIEGPESLDMTRIKFGRLGRSVESKQERASFGARYSDDSVYNWLYPVDNMISLSTDL